MKNRYAIGIDFGTLSARAVLIDIDHGVEVMSSVYGYQDAVIDEYLLNPEIKLLPDYALQNPMDYKDAVIALLKDIRLNSKVSAENIISIGVDFTACTVLPVDKDMIPLCMHENFSANPHAWVKLWKHHGAQDEADRINQIALKRNEKFLKRYGNTSSSEWMFAKVLETYRKAPEVYKETYEFVEAGDWVVWLLTGNDTSSTCMAGYKAFWSEDEGYPSAEYLEAVESGFSSVLEKLNHNICTVGTRAGGLTKAMADATGLKMGTSVAVAMIDAHSAVPVFCTAKENSLLMAMGTSLCHMLISKQEVLIDGIGGVVKDGILPGYYGYEAGQPAVGDIYDWFITNFATDECYHEASERNISPFRVMDERASKLRSGQSGLLALDWWNGNRSMLNNSNLTGVILGFTLNTKQEELYRAIIEATAFGTRNVIESMENQGLRIEHIYACGGLSRKSRLVMQIFADVLGREIITTSVEQTTAFGAAMYGMVAAGSERGGFDTFEELSERFKPVIRERFIPDSEEHRVYDNLFSYYKRTADYFGKDNLDIMESMKKIRGTVYK